MNLLGKTIINDQYGTQAQIKERIINNLDPRYEKPEDVFSSLLELVTISAKERRLIKRDGLIDYIDKRKFIQISALSKEKIITHIEMTTKGTLAGIIDYIEIADKRIKIPLKEVAVITEMIKQNHTKKIIITGDGGYGKSVCLKNISERLVDMSTITLHIRGERYSNVHSSSEISEEIGLRGSLESIIAKIAKYDTIVVIIDSLDVLSRNEITINMFTNFIDRISVLSNVLILCASRRFDLEYSPILSSLNWDKKIELPMLSEDVIEGILQKLDIIQKSHTYQNLIEICKTPLLLQILSKVIGYYEEGMESIWELFETYWKRYVIKIGEEGSEARKKACLEIIEKMFQKKSFILINDNIEESTAKNELISSGVLVIDRIFVSFFHQTFAEYLMSKTSHLEKDLAHLLMENKYNLFLRSILKTTLSVMKKLNPDNYFREIESIICESKVPFHLKIVPIDLIDESKVISPEEINIIQKAIRNENIDETSLLRSLKNEKWFDHLKEALLIPILKKQEYDRTNGALIQYLKRIAPVIQNELIIEFFNQIPLDSQNIHLSIQGLDIIAHLDELTVEPLDGLITRYINNENPQIRLRIIEILSKCEKSNPSYVLEKLENIFSFIRLKMKTWGVSALDINDSNTKGYDEYFTLEKSLVLLNKIIKYFPQKGIKTTLFQLKKFHRLEAIQPKDSDGDLINDGIFLIYRMENGKILERNHDTNIYPTESLVKAFEECFLELAEKDTNLFLKVLEEVKGHKFLIIRRKILSVLWRNFEKYSNESIGYFLINLKHTINFSTLDYEMAKILKENYWKLNSTQIDMIRTNLKMVFPDFAEQPVYMNIQLLSRLSKEEKKDIIIRPPASVSETKFLGSRIPYEQLKELNLNELKDELIRFKEGEFEYDPFSLLIQFEKIVSDDPVKYIDFILGFDASIPPPVIAAGIKGLRKCSFDELVPKLIKIIEKLAVTDDIRIRKSIFELISSTVNLIQEHSIEDLNQIVIPILERSSRIGLDPLYDYPVTYSDKPNLNDALTNGINTSKGALIEAIFKVFPFTESKEHIFKIISEFSKDKTSAIRATVLANLPSIIFDNDISINSLLDLVEKNYDPRVSTFIPIILWYSTRRNLERSLKLLYKLKNGYRLVKIIESNELSFRVARRLGWYGSIPKKLDQSIVEKLYSRKEIKRLKFEVRKQAFQRLVLLDLWGITEDNFIDKEIRKRKNSFHETLFQTLTQTLKLPELSKESARLLINLTEKEPRLIDSTFYIYIRAEIDSFKHLVPLIKLSITKCLDDKIFHLLKYLEKCSHKYPQEVTELINLVYIKCPNTMVFVKKLMTTILGGILTVGKLNKKSIESSLRILDFLFEDGIDEAREVFESFE